MIPIKYNLRSLRVRWVTTLLTIIAIGIVVFTSVLTFGMIAGIDHALSSSGDPEDIIVMRKGSTDEMSSTIAASAADNLAILKDVATGANGEKLASREFVTILIKSRRNNGGSANVIVRGLEQVGRQLRPDFKIVEGRDIVPGVNELITSKSMAERFEGLGVNEELKINNTSFKVVGMFTAGGSSAESEVWTDLRDLTSAQRYDGAISVVNMRVEDEEKRKSVMEGIRDDVQFKLEPITEEDYFENQKSSSAALKAIAYIIAGFLTIGAMFAAANTMYAAVSSRGREIGTLRAIGFPRRHILMSFLVESLVICLIGGALGCLATLPLNGLSGGTANGFTEITFALRFDAKVLMQGMILALAMGLLGGLFPAIRAIRLEIINALRQR